MLGPAARLQLFVNESCRSNLAQRHAANPLQHQISAVCLLMNYNDDIRSHAQYAAALSRTQHGQCCISSETSRRPQQTMLQRQGSGSITGRTSRYSRMRSQLLQLPVLAVSTKVTAASVAVCAASAAQGPRSLSLGLVAVWCYLVP